MSLSSWAKADHEILRVSLVDADGRVRQSRDFEAPLNRNVTCPVRFRVELVHDDGCSRVHQEIPLDCYE
jgi:hypothetical protein